MATFVHPGVFLRRTLFADAATCAVVGALMSVASAPLQRLTGLPAWLFVAAGLALLPFLAAQVLTVSVFAALEFTGLRGASAKNPPMR
jgi:hypothetical protein